MEYPEQSLQAYLRRQSNQLLEILLAKHTQARDHHQQLIDEIQLVLQERGHQPEEKKDPVIW